MSETCTFCSAQTLEWRTVHHDKLVRSFLSDPKLTRGHALVIPNRHVEPPDQLTNPESAAVIREAERLRAVMLGSFAVGVDVWQKTRQLISEGHNGTKMNHEHFHVLPSSPGDELYETGIVWSRPDNFSALTVPDAQEILEVLHP